MHACTALIFSLVIFVTLCLLPSGTQGRPLNGDLIQTFEDQSMYDTYDDGLQELQESLRQQSLLHKLLPILQNNDGYRVNDIRQMNRRKRQRRCYWSVVTCF